MISVCLASYNGEKYIKEQIDSICSQLGPDDEIIVSDDGSEDLTVSVVKSIEDSRVKLIRNAGNHCYTSNFYNALKAAKGDFIFLSDQDDVWLSNKVEIVTNCLREVDFVHTDAIIVDENLNVIDPSHNEFHGTKQGFIPNLIRSRYLGCCMAFRRNVLEALFPVPVYSNTYPHDLWIALIAERYFKTRLLNEPLMLYRRHGSNVSNGGESERPGVINIAKKVLIRFYYLYYVIRQRRYISRS